MIKRFDIFGKQIVINIYLGIRPLKETIIYGYTNRCIDGKYIITLDYDCPFDDFYMSELTTLQKKYKLSDFYIFATNKGFHAVCIDKVTLKTFIQIITDSSCDHNYREVPFRHGKKLWTLRFSEKNKTKPVFAVLINSKNKIYKQSLAHTLLLNKIFNMNIKPKRHDGLKKLITARYKI